MEADEEVLFCIYEPGSSKRNGVSFHLVNSDWFEEV